MSKAFSPGRNSAEGAAESSTFTSVPSAMWLSSLILCAANAIDWTLPAHMATDPAAQGKDVEAYSGGLDKRGRQPVMVDTIHSANGRESAMDLANDRRQPDDWAGYTSPDYTARW